MLLELKRSVRVTGRKLGTPQRKKKRVEKTRENYKREGRRLLMSV